MNYQNPNLAHYTVLLSKQSNDASPSIWRLSCTQRHHLCMQYHPGRWRAGTSLRNSWKRNVAKLKSKQETDKSLHHRKGTLMHEPVKGRDSGSK